MTPVGVSVMSSRSRQSAGERDWSQFASCLDEDPDLFFPVGERGQSLLQLEEARAVCESCAVKSECLQLAMDLESDHGVWGGLGPDERRRLRRELRRGEQHPRAATR